MNLDLTQLDPEEDSDTGYGDLAVLCELPSKLDCTMLDNELKKLTRESAKASRDEKVPGEAEEPDNGDFPDPEDFFGDGDDDNVPA